MNTGVDRGVGQWVPTMVEAGLRRCTEVRRLVSVQEPKTHSEQAVRAERLVALWEREARWWLVLQRWTYSRADVPLVYGRALVQAGTEANRYVEFYRDIAADWRRMAAGEPVCGVVGCGCGGVCGVPA
ncbi:MAG: hypothetical protein H0V41_16830 [Pseudonocardiales bacterium]|nr:hypothetical protein [Pseudonocardiales bacterium]